MPLPSKIPEPRVPLTPKMPHGIEEPPYEALAGPPPDGDAVDTDGGYRELMAVLRRIEARLERIEKHLDIKPARGGKARSSRRTRTRRDVPVPGRRSTRPSSYA